MTDTTTTDTPDAPPTPEEPGAAAPPAGGPPALPAGADEPSFWQRPYVERYLVPLVLPVAVVVGFLVYVLNVSRLFLSAHGHLPVVAGTVITVVILLGAALLAAAPNLRKSSIAMITAGFVLLVWSAGWVSLGHSEVKGAGGPVALATDLKASQDFAVTAAPGGDLAFRPNQVDATTGLAKFDVTPAAPGHTFVFEKPEVRAAKLELTPPDAHTTVAFFPEPGDYVFYCDVPGHRAAGMWGTVTVTGAPKTIDQALAEAGNAATPPAAG